MITRRRDKTRVTGYRVTKLFLRVANKYVECEKQEQQCFVINPSVPRYSMLEYDDFDSKHFLLVPLYTVSSCHGHVNCAVTPN